MPGNLVESGIQKHQAGELAEARQLYDQALKENPTDPEIHRLLGLLWIQAGDILSAIGYFQKAVELNPSDISHYLNLGATLKSASMWDAAKNCYESAIIQGHSNPDIHHQLGHLLKEKEHYIPAVEQFKKALQLKPGLADACFQLAHSYYRMGELALAKEQFNHHLTLPADKTATYHNLGCIAQLENQIDVACNYYQQALLLDPNRVESLLNFSILLSKQGNFKEAVYFGQKAVDIDSKNPIAYTNLGLIYKTFGLLSEALDRYLKALFYDPNNLEANYNAGFIYHSQFNAPMAKFYLGKALTLKPDHYNGLKMMSDLLVMTGQLETAKIGFSKAYQAEPNDGIRVREAISMPPIYHSLDEMNRCREALIQSIAELKADNITLPNPVGDVGLTNFYLVYQGLNDRPIQADLGVLFSASTPWLTVEHQPNPKPKIGFISRYFTPSHTIAKVFYGIIEGLSREKFDIIIFSIGYQEKLPIKTPYKFVYLPTGNMDRASQSIAAENLDILLYTDIGMDPLTYFLGFNRFAPVQCVTWGHPVTSGIPTIDYYLSSKFFETKYGQTQYTEKLVQLETIPTYFRRPDFEPTQLNRETLGLQPDQHLYLCPQSFFKLHPEFDDLVGQILRQDTNGVLVLTNALYPEWETIFLDRLAQTYSDILPQIKILHELPYPDFLTLISMADVMLDTLHFGGGRTTYEALFLGTPVVTLPTAYMRGRMAYGCYQKMGMEDCIASSPEDYIEKAVRLGTDPEYRQSIHEKILELNGTLFEDAQAIQAFESFFEDCLKDDKKI